MRKPRKADVISITAASALAIVLVGCSSSNDMDVIINQKQHAEINERTAPVGRVVVSNHTVDSISSNITSKQSKLLEKRKDEDKVAILARESGCMSCHQVNVKVVGPAYKDVAAKYTNDLKTTDMLVSKVLTGGAGIWGSVPMPPHSHLGEKKIRVLVSWILSH